MTDLTDRMRTCAAYILADACNHYHDELPLLLRDAADLLIDASNIIEAAKLGTVLVDDETAKALGLPMEVIPPLPPVDATVTAPGLWIAPGDTLPVANPYRSRHTCPKCDSRAGKRVSRQGTHLMLVCPACAHQWEWRNR